MIGIGLLFAGLLGLVFSSEVVANGAGGAIYETDSQIADGVDTLDIHRKNPLRATVWAIEPVNDMMLVGGSFKKVRTRWNYGRVAKPYLAAFDPESGEYLNSFHTQPDGPVRDLSLIHI